MALRDESMLTSPNQPAAPVPTALGDLKEYHGPMYYLNLLYRRGGLRPGRDNEQIQALANSIASGAYSTDQIKALEYRNPHAVPLFDQAINARNLRVQTQQALSPFFKDPMNPDYQGAIAAAIKLGRSDLASSFSDELHKREAESDKNITPFERTLMGAGIQPNSKEWNTYMRKYLDRLTAPTALMAGDNLSLENDPETRKSMALQYLAGDSSVLQGLGYGVQGSKNRILLRREITQQAKNLGLTPAQIAAKIAEFQGVKAGERALGTRTAQVEMAANEANKMADQAVTASRLVPRTNIKSINDAMQAVQKGTASPALRKFVAANNALINAYARAISPSGVPTVHDKEHARDMLSTAFAQGDYDATVAQMKQEMSAALAAPGAARKHFRDAITAGPGEPAAEPTTKQPKVVDFNSLRK